MAGKWHHLRFCATLEKDSWNAELFGEFDKGGEHVKFAHSAGPSKDMQSLWQQFVEWTVLCEKEATGEGYKREDILPENDDCDLPDDFVVHENEPNWADFSIDLWMRQATTGKLKGMTPSWKVQCWGHFEGDENLPPRTCRMYHYDEIPSCFERINAWLDETEKRRLNELREEKTD